MYDAQISGDLFDLPAGAVRMAAGAEYREESVSDVPGRSVPARPDLRHRGGLGGRVTRQLGGCTSSSRCPLLESLELSPGGALRRLQRLRRHDQSEGRRALGADRDAGVPRFVGHGLPCAVARADRPRTFAGIAVLHRHLRLRRQASGVLRADSTTTSSSPAIRTSRRRSRRRSTSVSPGKPTDSHRADARLLGHQAGEQDRRGAVRLHLPAVLRRPGQHGLRARRAAAGRHAGPAADHQRRRSSTSASRRPAASTSAATSASMSVPGTLTFGLTTRTCSSSSASSSTRRARRS